MMPRQHVRATAYQSRRRQSLARIWDGAASPAAGQTPSKLHVLCQNPRIGTDLAFRPLGRSAVFADQAAKDLPALDPGGDIDGVAGLA